MFVVQQIENLKKIKYHAKKTIFHEKTVYFHEKYFMKGRFI